MQNKTFIYWLFNKDQKALYEDVIIREADEDNLRPDGQPARLEYSPDGWNETLVKYGRNTTYLGLFRDFTASMNFKKDGAKIVKDAMWKLGMEAILYLGINKLNKTVYPPKYEPWYIGELDFSKFKQSQSNAIINVMEGGLSKYLKAFENTTYEIPIDEDPEAQLVKMDGFPFSNRVEYVIYDDSEFYTRDNKTYTIGMGIITQEGSTQGMLNLDQPKTGFSDDNPFMQCDSKTLTAKVGGSITINVTTPATIMVFVFKKNSVSLVETRYYILNAAAPIGVNTYNFDFDINLIPSDKLYLLATTASGISFFPYFKITGTSLIVSYEVTFDPTIIKALKPLRLFQKLVDKMTEGRFTATSDLLDSMDDILITSGSAIRNHEGSDPTVTGSIIKTSVSDFFKAMRIKGAGLGIENNVLRIEKTSYFFGSGVSMDLGEVNDLEIVVAEDLVFNTVKVGYANQTYDQVNGKDEFNVTQNYTTPHTRIVKELDLTSPFRADAYGIELMRLNLDGKDTTDNSADNDTFFLNVVAGTPYYELNRPTYSAISGLLHPAGMFNIELSPKTNLLNNGDFIHSVLDFQNTGFVKFQSGEKNSELSRTKLGITITEKADIQIADLPKKLFRPYYLSFKVPTDFNFLQLINSNPYDKISFSYNRNKYYGYLFDGGVKPSDRDIQTIKLLCAPETNLQQLIIEK